MKLNKAEKFVKRQIELGKTHNQVREAIFEKLGMCVKCEKNNMCYMACHSLSNVPKKDLTADEWKRVHAYESFARDNTGYGN